MPSKPEPHSIGKPEDFPDGKPVDVDIETSVGNRNLIVFRQNQEIRAWLNVCPHQGQSLNWAPGKFLRDKEGNLVCSAHGAVFRLSDGLCIGGPCKGDCLRSVPTELGSDGIVAHFTL